MLIVWVAVGLFLFLWLQSKASSSSSSTPSTPPPPVLGSGPPINNAEIVNYSKAVADDALHGNPLHLAGWVFETLVSHFVTSEPAPSDPIAIAISQLQSTVNALTQAVSSLTNAVESLAVSLRTVASAQDMILYMTRLTTYVSKIVAWGNDFNSTVNVLTTSGLDPGIKQSIVDDFTVTMTNQVIGPSNATNVQNCLAQINSLLTVAVPGQSGGALDAMQRYYSVVHSTYSTFNPTYIVPSMGDGRLRFVNQGYLDDVWSFYDTYNYLQISGFNLFIEAQHLNPNLQTVEIQNAVTSFTTNTNTQLKMMPQFRDVSQYWSALNISFYMGSYIWDRQLNLLWSTTYLVAQSPINANWPAAWANTFSKVTAPIIASATFPPGRRLPTVQECLSLCTAVLNTVPGSAEIFPLLTEVGIGTNFNSVIGPPGILGYPFVIWAINGNTPVLFDLTEGKVTNQGIYPPGTTGNPTNVELYGYVLPVISIQATVTL